MGIWILLIIRILQISLSTNRPLYEEEWFHGVLPREEVVRLLNNDGDFLVRETIRNEESQIVLSVCWNGHKHFIVQTTGEGNFRFEGERYLKTVSILNILFGNSFEILKIKLLYISHKVKF